MKDDVHFDENTGKLYLNGKHVGTIKGKDYEIYRKSEDHFYILGRGYPISTTILQCVHCFAPFKTVQELMEHLKTCERRKEMGWLTLPQDNVDQIKYRCRKNGRIITAAHLEMDLEGGD